MTETLGTRHKELRKRLGLSLDDVAQAAGMSKTGVWEIEKGRRDPRLSTIRKLASALGMSVYDLLSTGDITPNRSTREMTNDKELLAAFFATGLVVGFALGGLAVSLALSKQVNWWKASYCHVTPHELEFCNDQ